MKYKWLLVGLLVWITLIFNKSIFSILIIFAYLLYHNEKLCLIVYFVTIIICNINIQQKVIDQGTIKIIKPSYIIVTNGFNKGIIYTDGLNYNYGDLLSLEGAHKLDSNDFFIKNEINYSYKIKEIISSKSTIKSKLFDYVLNFKNKEIRSLYLKVLFNINDNQLADLFYLTGFYYSSFILFINTLLGYFIDRKYLKYVDVLILVFLGIIFGFEFVIFRLLFNVFLNIIKFNKLDKQGLKILFVCICFKSYILSLEFVLPTFLGLYHCFTKRSFFKKQLVLCFIQLIYFKYTNLLLCLINSFLFRLYGVVYFLLILFLPIPHFSIGIVKLFNYLDTVLNNDLFVINGIPTVFTFFFIVIIQYMYHKYFMTYVCFILCFLLGINNAIMCVSFINVKQGDAILIHGTFNRYNVLIDTGSEINYKLLKNYLNEKGVRNIDYLIITHDDEDHNGNIENICNDFNVRHLNFTHDDIFIKDLKLYSLNHVHDNDNDSSLVYLLDVNGIKLLFCGDISKDVEFEFCQRFQTLQTDILKLAHHGSNTSTSKEFLSLTRPKIGIISSGKKYNHPSKEVIQNLLTHHIYYMDTKVEGNIEIYFTKFLNFFKTKNNTIGLID